MLALRAVFLLMGPAISPVAHLEWGYPGAVGEDIAGYRIFYGTVSHADVLEPEDSVTAAPYSSVIVVNDPEATSYDIPLAGVYCFRMTAFNSGGEESIFSNEVVWSSGLMPPTLA